jgi:hypothetical protein
MKFMQGNSKRAKAPGKLTAESKNSTDLLNRAIPQETLYKAKMLYRINQALPTMLSWPIGQHCWLMNFTPSSVTIGIDAAEWLIPIRQQEYHLKTYLEKHINLSSPFKIKYLVRPQHINASLPQSTLSKRPLKISTRNKQFLQMVAHTLTDERLKKALLNLAAD